MQHEFNYKLDFYYQQALIYLVTLILYAGIKGTIIEDSLTVVFHDPIMYIIAFFVGVAFVTLLLNRIRDRKIIITPGSIIFQNKFNKKELSISDIEWIYIGKERNVQTSGRFQVVVVKLKHRRRSFRIRIGRYERDRELVRMMEDIATKVPKREKRFQLRKKKLSS